MEYQSLNNSGSFARKEEREDPRHTGPRVDEGREGDDPQTFPRGSPEYDHGERD
jgi:hypothetical protein